MGFCAVCGKQTKIKRHLLGKNKHHFCNKTCSNKGMTIEARLYPNRDGRTILASTGHIMQATGEYYDYYGKDNRKHRKYKAQHRLLIASFIGRPLKRNSEPVWHLNGVPTDNRLENLYVFSDIGEMMRALSGTIPFPSESNVQNLCRRGQTGTNGSP
jgi:hypothetical protein